jgi:putative DNA primase/helicase
MKMSVNPGRTDAPVVSLHPTTQSNGLDEAAHPSEAARHYTAAYGLALVPIPSINGNPTKGPTGKGWNDPANVITDPDAAARYWAEHPDHNMGALLEDSRIVSFDVDGLDATRHICAELGFVYEAMLEGALRIQGRDGRDKALFAAPEGAALGAHKLVWPARTRDEKPITVFELRAGRVQDVLPPSIHPDTGKPYIWRVKPNGGFPPLPAELWELWRNWPSYFDMLAELCPWAESKPKPSPKRGREGVSIIAAYNQAHDVRELLGAHGYKPKGKQRWLAPGSESGMPGVRLLGDGRVYSSHASDPLNDGHAHDGGSVQFVQKVTVGKQAMA